MAANAAVEQVRRDPLPSLQRVHLLDVGAAAFKVHKGLPVHRGQSKTYPAPGFDDRLGGVGGGGPEPPSKR